jgi:hypothetical protein
VAITAIKTAFVATGSTSIGLSQVFAVTAASTNPAYLVLTALDRNEYTAGATGATGSLSGNGHILSLSGIGFDGRGAGIVFAYQAASGRYYSSTYGYLDQLTYTSSASLNDVTNLSLFGANDPGLATSYAADAYSMMQLDASGYLGSATIATQPSFTGTVPVQATPNSIATIANSFVGKAWNMDGCWVLASTIAAEAGASLPVQSTAIGLPGQANGEWIVAYNGPAGQSGNWQSLVTAGEIVVIGTQGGGGHITTCVSGSGGSAMLVDNITYVTSHGQVVNSARDGSSSDIIVSAPHAASQEWAGVNGSSVVIYELDTPIVRATVPSDTLACRASQGLASLFTATDPAGKAIASWQIYDMASTDFLQLNGATFSDHSAAAALTATSLGSVSLLAGGTITTDTLEVRAFNGSYWGDWQSLLVTVAAAPPVLATPTPNQTWVGGKPVTLALPATTFKDPQGQALSYTARLSNGQALPSWLKFNTNTDSFSGTAPITAQTLAVTVTATDRSGLSVSDKFSSTILGAPTVTRQTANQIWTEGKAVSLALPANTFTDPQAQKLSYAAHLGNGQALPSWLRFNAVTETFSGTAPTTVQTLGITVTATDGGGLAASENFAVSVQAPVTRPGATIPAQPTIKTLAAGQQVGLVVPTSAITGALSANMTFAAYSESAPTVASALHADPATGGSLGAVWTAASGTGAPAAAAADLFGVAAIPSSAYTASTTNAGSLGIVQQFDASHLAALPAFH